MPRRRKKYRAHTHHTSGRTHRATLPQVSKGGANQVS